MSIYLGAITQLFHVFPLLNCEYIHTDDGTYTLAKNWSKIPLAVTLETIVENIRVQRRALAEQQSIEQRVQCGHVEHVVDYTRHVSFQNRWQYSQKAIVLVRSAVVPVNFVTKQLEFQVAPIRSIHL